MSAEMRTWYLRNRNAIRIGSRFQELFNLFGVVSKYSRSVFLLTSFTIKSHFSFSCSIHHDSSLFLQFIVLNDHILYPNNRKLFKSIRCCYIGLHLSRLRFRHIQFEEKSDISLLLKHLCYLITLRIRLLRTAFTDTALSLT